MSSYGLATVEKYAPPLAANIYYPETDGQPVAETDVHIDVLLYLRVALQDHFRDEPRVYAAGNMLMYYEEGNPKASVAPDVFVVKGVEKKRRRVYKIWEEGKAPDVVFEITSKSTHLEDMGLKRELYRTLGVQEYILFDPLNEYLKPQLRLYRLADSEYMSVLAPRGIAHSEVLDLELRVEDTWLCLYDPYTGEKILTMLEAYEAQRQSEKRVIREAQARQQAEKRAAREAQARQQAEAEIARLQAELARLRGQE